VARRLVKRGIPSIAIHGNKSQNSRQRSLEGFRKNHYQVLVATDVAARGIDIDGVTHVVNYDLPEEPESYVHRIGRTGRAGTEGIALSLCMESEMDALRGIEKFIGISIPVHRDYPAGEEHLAADSKWGPRGRRKKSQSKNDLVRNGRAPSGRKSNDRSSTNRDIEAMSGKTSQATNRRKSTPAKRASSKSSRRSAAKKSRGSESVATNEMVGESRRENDAGPAQSSKQRKPRSASAKEGSVARGSGASKSKRRSTKKKYKVKGSTSNSRTTPKPLSKNGQGRKARGKSADTTGNASGPQPSRIGDTDRESTLGSRSSTATKPRRSKPKSPRNAKRRPKS
jgi:ATP-dependent RNA helicase RhlE